MFQEMLVALRKSAPLIHCITNYVTINDCANLLLACGASPVMADDPEEAAEITAKSSGLVINIGALHQQAIPAMLCAGRKANELGHPVVLDPVGAGSSAFRMRTVLELLSEIHFTVIRGNSSEIRALNRGFGGARGVDAEQADLVTEDNLRESEELVRHFAQKTGAVTALTGAIDLVSDGEQIYEIRNGCSEMRGVTGTGCQLSAMAAAYAAANPGEPLRAAAAAVCAMGVCGEQARARMRSSDGSASFRTYLIDAVSCLSLEELEKGARYELR